MSVTFALDDEPEEDNSTKKTVLPPEVELPPLPEVANRKSENENKKFIENYKTSAASQVILEPKNLPVTIDPGGPESIQNTNNLDENDEYEDIIMEIQMNRSRGSLRRSSGGSFRYQN